MINCNDKNPCTCQALLEVIFNNDQNGFEALFCNTGKTHEINCLKTCRRCLWHIPIKSVYILRIWYTYLCFQSQKNQSTYEFVFVYFIIWIRHLTTKWNCLKVHNGIHLNNNSYISSQLLYMHIWCWWLFCYSAKDNFCINMA